MSDILLLILSLSLSGTLIAGLCFAVKALWKKKLSKSVLYYLWLIALVRLVLPFSFEGALLNRIYESDLKSPVSTVLAFDPVSAVDTTQTAFSVSAESITNPIQITETVSSPEIVSVTTPTAVSVDTQVMTPTNTTPAKPFDFESLTLILWFAGFASFCIFTLTSYSRFAVKLKRTNQPADKNALTIAKQLKCKIKIYRNPLAQTPMLIGLFRQIVILPDTNYTDEELKSVLTHELTHKRRHDLLYKWFALFVNAIHWFNPIVWLVRREVSRACELSCDEAVIQNLQTEEKQTYGETLINLAAAHRYPAGVIATTLCEEKQTLKERLGAIMAYQKKGLWNRALSCVLIVAISASGTLLGACGTTILSLPSKLVGQSGDYPESVNIYAPDFFTNVSEEIAENTKQQWLEKMSERYGVKFNIIPENYKGYSSASSQETEEPTEDVAFGIVTVFTKSVNIIKGNIVNKSYMPLEGYLEDNAVWNALPDDFKSLFEVDGHIYAIPTSISRVQSARIIRNEALESTGGTVTDLDSFRDFSLTYEQLMGTAASKGIYFSDVRDILNAFGLYPGIDSMTPFCYDPTEDCYVDFMTKSTAVEALEYLRELYNAGALYGGMDANLSKIYATFDSGIFASAYDQYYDYENCTEVLTMNSEYPQTLYTNISGYAMTKDTPQPQETINLLIDMLFGSEQNYLQCRLGSSDNYTLNSDGTITIEMAQDSTGNYVTPGMPNLAGELSDIFPYSNADILYSKNGVVTTESKTNAEKYKARLKLLEDSLENGSVVEIPPKYLIIQSATYDADLSDDSKPSTDPRADKACTIYFSMAIKNSRRTVQQIVDEYREAMLNMGGNFMLDEMNAAIGKKTAYYYG